MAARCVLLRVTKSKLAAFLQFAVRVCKSELHTFCSRSPAHMDLPYLAGVVTENDVRQKGSGSYAADFVSWAKIMQLINKHAPGWIPHLAYNNGSPVFQAPNGSAFVLILFKHIDGTTTAEWPQAVMDNRNNPIPHEKVTARDLTDTHRRAICSAACAFFSLGYELWAREEYAAAESSSSQGEAPKAQVAPKNSPSRAGIPLAQVQPAAQASTEGLREELETTLIELLQTRLAKGETLVYLDTKADLWKLKKGGSRVQQMNIDQLRVCIDELSSKKY